MVASFVLKFLAAVLIRRQFSLHDVHASLAEQQAGPRAVRRRRQRMLRTVLGELLKEPQRLIELSLLSLRADRILGRLAERHRSFVRDDCLQFGRQISEFLQLIQIQHRPVVMLSPPQPVEELAHRFSGVTAPTETQHESGSHDHHP